MNRLPSVFRSTPPSPRTDSVTSRPRTDGGQTMPVGWNWTNSMFISVAPGQQGERVPVAAVLPGVGRDLEGPPDAAGGEDDRRRLEQDETCPVSRMYPKAPAIRPDASFSSRVIVVSANTRIRASGSPNSYGVRLLQRDDALLQRADHLQAGPVAHVREPRVLVPAEVPLGDLAVRASGRRARPTPRAPRPGPGPPWRAVPPSAGCSGTSRRAWCRGSGPASCPWG